MRWLTLVLLVVAADGSGAVSQETEKAAAKPKDAEQSKASSDKNGKPDASKTRADDQSKDADKAAERPVSSKFKRVFDTSYTPSVGDRAVLYCRDDKGEEEFAIWAAKTPDAFREYTKAHLLESGARMDQPDCEAVSPESAGQGRRGADRSTRQELIGCEPTSRRGSIGN